MTKFSLISDIHLNHYIQIGTQSNITTGIKQFCDRCGITEDENEFLVVAGDLSDYNVHSMAFLEYTSKIYKAVFWCHGNHDMALISSSQMKTYKNNSFLRLKELIDFSNSLPNVFYLDGQVEWNGLKILGNFGGYDFNYSNKHFGISKEVMLKHWQNWFDCNYWRMNGSNQDPLSLVIDGRYITINPLVYQGKCEAVLESFSESSDIIVTHCGPLAHDIPMRYHSKETGYFYSDYQHILNSMKDNSVYCYGHTHDTKYLLGHSHYGNIKLVCNPYGYPHEKNAASKVITVEL